MDAMKMIQVNIDVDDVFNNMFENILDLIPKPEPDPDPEPNNDMYFPVKYDQAGINFWKRENWGNGTLQRDMTYGTRSNGAFHAGYDIGSGGNSGYKVYAVRDGTVTHVENRSTAGFVIAIDHSTDKYHTLYMHLVENSNVVNVGDKVKAGQHIATMGATGGNYAIHLHIELSETGKFHTKENTIDPEPYLKVTADNKTSLPSPK
jgi:murein DD-endopeptidase MepM/ murein hydrolase activator NlpD